MAPTVHTVEIARPPEEVFRFATDPSRFPEWQEDVVRVDVHGADPPGVGSRFTTTRRIGRVEHHTTQEITRLESPTGWAARGVDGPLRPSASISVEPLDGGTRSRVRFELDFEGRGIGKLLAPEMLHRMAAKRAPDSYHNLKQLLERGE
ncbi:SRPBCC family protein [Pseudonocardia acaciae]|uniref:SRPBCC family protein n=1 Tax=Pseudonocardia acaciae TaxID=551276 RepID=UPI00048B403A|nr:SRPBCC family protein [Pseudonocardia acaciae]